MNPNYHYFIKLFVLETASKLKRLKYLNYQSLSFLKKNLVFCPLNCTFNQGKLQNNPIPKSSQQIYQSSRSSFQKFKTDPNMFVAEQSSTRIRIITLFMPPSHDPLLTTYRKQINPKILPLKRSLSILSNLKQYPTVKEQKLQLTEKDYIKINRSYQSLKKFRKSYFGDCEQILSGVEGEKDPQYLRLVEMRMVMLRKRQKEEKNIAHLFKTQNLKEKGTILTQIVTETWGGGRYQNLRPKTEARTSRINFSFRPQVEGGIKKQGKRKDQMSE